MRRLLAAFLTVVIALSPQGGLLAASGIIGDKP